MSTEVELGVSIDVLGIANAISESVKKGSNRSGFVKNLMEQAFYAAGQEYNIMVFNLSQDYEEYFNGVKFYASATYDSVVYGIWAFEDGEFTNNGDGGWINWAFTGWYDRDGKYVKFNRP